MSENPVEIYINKAKNGNPIIYKGTVDESLIEVYFNKTNKCFACENKDLKLVGDLKELEGSKVECHSKWGLDILTGEYENAEESKIMYFYLDESTIIFEGVTLSK